jgi:hypothetical protein
MLGADGTQTQPDEHLQWSEEFARHVDDGGSPPQWVSSCIAKGCDDEGRRDAPEGTQAGYIGKRVPFRRGYVRAGWPFSVVTGDPHRR